MVTFTNPTPAGFIRQFHSSVAALGTDRVLIGGGASAAHLFSTNGTLLTTFTNPLTASLGFGCGVAAVGMDLVLIGDYADYTGGTLAGAAYLFRTNGTLLTAFTNPTPAYQYFGWSVAAVGADRVLIGTRNDGTQSPGAAYLFRTNGSLLTTFANPTPVIHDDFGSAVAVVGTDGVLAGAMGSGAAYLFRTNGSLLTTFTNPVSPVGLGFGYSVAAVGSDRVLIGEYWANDGAGKAYLFNTHGTLLSAFRYPERGFGRLGYSVAALGADRVLLGAYYGPGYSGGLGSPHAGAAYLFNTNGVLLAIFNNPKPATDDFFGIAVTGVGTDQVAIVASQAAYLISTPQIVAVSWPAPAEGWVLEYTHALPSEPVSSWPQVAVPYQTTGETISVTFTNHAGTGNQFFRLHKP